MARYDRIARLSSPDRDSVFTGWMAVRDLESQERDPDLGRRARLRFLAVRLVHRLAGRGDTIDPASLQQQCDAVRAELGQLSSRDPERQRLNDFLTLVATGNAGAVVQATLELADAARVDGALFAAEEFYRAGIGLAERHGLKELQARGLKALAELDQRKGQAASA